MGQDQEENAIVTSTGAFVVAWDFAKVKKGQLDKYEIKKYVRSLLSTLAFPSSSIPPPIGPSEAKLPAFDPTRQVRPVRRARQLQVWRRQGNCTS